MAELRPEARAGEPAREVTLTVCRDLSPLTSLSGRCRDLGEGDLEDRRGRGTRGDRVFRGEAPPRLRIGGERFLIDGGERLRGGGDRDRTGRVGRLRLLSLPCGERC